MNDIEQARRLFQAESERIRAQADAMIREREEPLRAAVNAAVARAYSEGMSISEICRRYGTTSRNTIIDILKAEGVYRNPGFGGRFGGNR